MTGDLPTLRTARLVLRPFVLTDAPDVQRLAGAAEVADTTLSIPHPYPDGAAREWIAGHADAWAGQENAVFAITTDADGLVGAINLRLELKHARAEVGYWIAVPFWGRGFASEALAAVVDFGFDSLGLHRIHAHHLGRNPASGRVMEKVGMRREGHLREHMLHRGGREDVVCWAVLRTERPARGS